MPVLGLPELYKIVAAYPRVTTGATIYPWASQYVSLKNCHMCYILANCAMATTNALAFTIEQATTAAGGSTKAITVAVPIWLALDTSVSMDLVRQTAAVGFTTDALAKNKIVLFQVDPATLDVANGFCYIVLKCASASSTNYVGAEFFLDNRYMQATPPSAMA